MPRIHPVDIQQSHPAAAAQLAEVRSKLGMVPNLFATLAHAPAALNGYLQLSDALARGALTAAQREIVALAAAQANRCQYCLSAHTALARAAGLGAADIAAARAGSSGQKRDAAIAALARTLVEQRGIVSDAELQAARADGLDDALILEVVVNVALNILTNYVNHVADTAIDFPVVELARAA